MTTGKVLKERRAHRERGRMGSSLTFFFFATWSERRGKNALKNSLNHSECPPTMTQSASFVFSTTHAANSSSASLPHRSTFLFPSLFRASHDGI